MSKLYGYYIVFLLGGFPLLSFLPLPSITIAYRGMTVILGVAVLFLMILQRGLYLNKWCMCVILFLSLYFSKLILDFIYMDFDYGRDKVELSLLIVSSIVFPLLVLLFSKPEFLNVPDVTFKLFFILFVVCLLSVASGIIFGFKYRLSGNSILNSISLGHHALTCLILGSFILLNYNISGGKKLLLKIALPISVICLILVASRGPLVAMFTLLAIYLLINKSGIMKNVLILFLSIGFLLLALAISESFFDAMLNRMTVNLDEQDGEARVFLWRLAIDEFIQSPIIGSHTTTEIGYVHNMFLEILMSTGLVGFLWFLFICLSSWKRLYSYIKENDERLIFGLIAIQYLIASFFSGTVYSNDLVWIYLSIFLLISNGRVAILPENKSREK